MYMQFEDLDDYGGHWKLFSNSEFSIQSILIQIVVLRCCYCF